MPEKIKISKEEFATMYEWSDEMEDGHDNEKGEVVETGNMITETFDDAVERKSKEELKKWHLDRDG